MDPRVAEIMRRKTPLERLKIAEDLFETAREIIRASVRHHHPEWTPEQVHDEVNRRLTHEGA